MVRTWFCIRQSASGKNKKVKWKLPRTHRMFQHSAERRGGPSSLLPLVVLQKYTAWKPNPLIRNTHWWHLLTVVVISLYLNHNKIHCVKCVQRPRGKKNKENKNTAINVKVMLFFFTNLIINVLSASALVRWIHTVYKDSYHKKKKT